MTTNAATPTSQKLVVLLNGARVSKIVHESAAAAEAEKAIYVKRLQESKQDASIPSLTISNLLLG